MATCAECVHVEVCSKKNLHVAVGMNITPRFKYKRIEQECERFKDRARFVELPCKVGDEVYFIFTSTDGTKRINPVKVCNYTITTEMMKIHTTFGYFTEHDLNKDVFLTREEAEQSLMKEREA